MTIEIRLNIFGLLKQIVVIFSFLIVVTNMGSNLLPVFLIPLSIVKNSPPPDLLTLN